MGEDRQSLLASASTKFRSASVGDEMMSPKILRADDESKPLRAEIFVEL